MSTLPPRTPTPFQRRLPNLLSVLRICCVPVVVLLLWCIDPARGDHDPVNRSSAIWATVLFVVAGISDILDGFFARRHHTISVFGKLFDPLADKLITLSVLIMLIPLGRMAAWLVVLHMMRETTVTSLRSLAANEGIIIAASKWGKMKNAFSTVAIAMLIVHEPFFGVQWQAMGWVLFLIATALSLISGVDYVVKFLRRTAL